MTPDPNAPSAPKGAVFALSVALVAAVVCGGIAAYIAYNAGYDAARATLQARLDEQAKALEKTQVQKPKKQADEIPPVRPTAFSAADLQVPGLTDLPPRARDELMAVFNTIAGPCEPCVDNGQSFAICLLERPVCENMPILAARAVRLSKQGLDRIAITQALTFERPWARVDVGSSPTEGPADAPVTIVEFTDFQCPYCARAQKTLTEIRDRYGDKVRFVYKSYPINTHKAARPAALAAMAAHNQGRFWEYKRLLFERQRELKQETTLEAIAREVGLDIARWEKDRASELTASKVSLDEQQARRLRVRSTPTFYVNGYRIKGARALESFTRIIDAELTDLDAK
ncbi:MAG: thioredoxin domain-containing protein [Deltaproteobacteria bacterium]|nr:thioredoxin domain-containing protein [Deltaproteobacteria bacterium]